MLVLSRCVGEIVRVGEHVSITVLSVKGKQIRLGISAPKDVPVHREEVYRQIAAQGIGANENDEPQAQDLVP